MTAQPRKVDYKQVHKQLYTARNDPVMSTCRSCHT
jgi:hypothetical protein